MARAFIAVGSNIEPEANVRLGLELLARRVLIAAVSTFYRTAPVGRSDQSPFVNGMVAVHTDLPPRQLKHEVLREIERELGRVRSADRYAPRQIDLDLVVYDDVVDADGDPVLPDPELATRPFLAIPLAEIAPALMVPGTGRTAASIAAGLEPHDMQPLRRLSELLRRELLHEHRQGCRAGPRAAGRDRGRPRAGGA